RRRAPNPLRHGLRSPPRRVPHRALRPPRRSRRRNPNRPPTKGRRPPRRLRSLRARKSNVKIFQNENGHLVDYDNMHHEKTDVDPGAILNYATFTGRPGSRRKALFYCLIGVTAINGMLNLYLKKLWRTDDPDCVYINRVVDIGLGLFVFSLLLGVLSLLFI